MNTGFFSIYLGYFISILLIFSKNILVHFLVSTSKYLEAFITIKNGILSSNWLLLVNRILIC